MKILDEYIKLQEEIFKYFGYEENWVTIPIDDARKYYWYLEQKEDGRGHVGFAEEKEVVIQAIGVTGGNPALSLPYAALPTLPDDYYENTIYTQRFLNKWVYEGKDYTMICVDTNTDGNKFLQIFDNQKRVSER